jgi:succinate-semialdehyde dehydrogenase / glutarate-semialdehyde dehydrogenase
VTGAAGDWIAAHGDRLAALGALVEPLAARPRLEVTAPFTGAVMGGVPACTADDLTAAVQRARAAQPAWQRLGARRRAAVLLRFHDLLLRHAGEVLDLIQLEAGKARTHAAEEVLDAANQARYLAHAGPGVLRPRPRPGAIPVLTVATEHHRPCGVVGVVAPWNFPLVLGITDALAALMAGNAVVVKPASQAPFTALWALELLRRAGLPAGAAQIVTGPGAELGPALVEAVDFLMFTGGGDAGRELARQAASRLIGCALELGGKNATIVLDDADLRRAVPGVAYGVTDGCGQVCVSHERLYVQAGVYEGFTARLAQTLAGLRLGAGLDWDADVGSLASPAQLEKVRAHVDDALAKGARVLTGGHARPDVGPCFFEPTLLAGVTEDMTLCREETFGPVAAVYRVAGVDEAVARVNDSRYGLNAAIWTRDTRRAYSVARRLRCGTVGINDSLQAAWGSHTPMGGFKDSGLGRRHGAVGLLKYTEAQSVAVQRLLALERLPLLGHRGHNAAMIAALRILRHVPGVK